MELIPPSSEAHRKDSQAVEYEEFLKENHEFLMYGPSQSSIKMLEAFISSENVPFEYIKSQLRLLIFQTLEEMAMNDIQVVYWSILIEKYVWKNSNIELRLSLAFTALLAKESLGENIDYLLLKYAQKEDFFKELYFTWSDNKETADISVVQINKQYKKLSNLRLNVVNYNFYVDEILLHYLPYCFPEKRKNRNRKNQDLPLVNTVRNESIKVSEPLPMPKLAKFGDELLTPLPLLNSSSGGKLQGMYSNGNSGCSQYLCFDA